MNGKVLFGFVVVFIIGLAFIGLAGGLPGMHEGANKIGDAVGDNIDALLAIEQAVGVWAGPQRGIYPNQHAVANHGDDAYATTDCYNRNGTFHVMRTMDGDWHLLCRDDDGSIRDMILKQRSENEFDLVNAFTPKDGKLKSVLDWIGRKNNAGKATLPQNSQIYVDGSLAP